MRFLVVSLLLDSPCRLRRSYQQQSRLFYRKGDSTVSVETQVNNVVVRYLLRIITMKSLQDVIPGTRPDILVTKESFSTIFTKNFVWCNYLRDFPLLHEFVN